MEDETANTDTESGKLTFKGLITKMEEEVVTTDMGSCDLGLKGLLHQFIRAYESHRVLWDKDHADYTNRHIRNKAMEKLVKIYSKIKPGAGLIDVKKKINSLRSNYRKELQKITDSQVAANGDWDEIYKPRSWVFYELTFLGNIGSINLHLVKPKSPKSGEHSEAEHERPDYSMENQESTSEGYSPERSFSIEIPKKKQKTKRIERVHSRDITATSYYNYKSEDNIHQATVWANKLNCLEPLQRIYAEKAINDILFEAELGNLSRKSVTMRDGDGISETIIVAKQEDEVISRM